MSVETRPVDDSPAPDEPVAARHPPIPRAVWLITALNVAVLLAYTVLLPAWRAPDEPQHADLALYLAQGHGYPDYDAHHLDRGLERSLGLVHFSSGSRHLLAGEAPRRSDRPSFRELDDGKIGGLSQIP